MSPGSGAGGGGGGGDRGGGGGGDRGGGGGGGGGDRGGGGGGGGRKVDPTGKQALFSAAPAAAPDRASPGAHNEGKEALFSMTPWRPGTVVVECSECRVRRRASLLDVGARLTFGSIWFPGRRHPHWMGCPTCGRRQWCRIGWVE